MKKYSARPAEPDDDKVLVPVDGAQLAADANPFVWALAVRWGSTIDTGTTAVPAYDLQPHRSEARHAQRNHLDLAGSRSEVDTEVAAATRHCAPQLVPVPRVEW
jgi:hypothetical protein